MFFLLLEHRASAAVLLVWIPPSTATGGCKTCTAKQWYYGHYTQHRCPGWKLCRPRAASARHLCLQIMHLQWQHIWHTANPNAEVGHLYWPLTSAPTYAAFMQLDNSCMYQQGSPGDIVVRASLLWALLALE